MALAQHVITLRSPCTRGVGRRVVLAGAASSLAFAAAGVQPAIAAEGVVDRAKTGQLTTDRVIYRAVNDILVNPAQINECDALESIYKIDMKAADEMKVSNEAMLKLSAAAMEADRRSLGGKSTDVFKESYAEPHTMLKSHCIHSAPCTTEATASCALQVVRDWQARGGANQRASHSHQLQDRSRVPRWPIPEL